MPTEHVDIQDPQIHEPKGAGLLVTPSTDTGKFYQSDGAGSGTWAKSSRSSALGRLSIQNADFGKGASSPTQTTIGNYSIWSFTTLNDAVFSINLPADLDIAEDIEVHIEWGCPTAVASTFIVWDMAWSLIPNDASEALTSPTLTGTMNSGDIQVPALANSLTNYIGTIPASNLSEGDILGITLTRPAASGTAPASDPWIVAVHLEYTTKV